MGLIDSALRIIIDKNVTNSPITIVTNCEKSIKIITLEENTDRPEILSDIYRKKNILNNRGIELKIRFRQEIITNNEEITSKEIPFTYNEIKPIIRKKIIKNIWIKKLEEDTKYHNILEIKNIIYSNLNRNEYHLNNIRLGQFVTRHSFPICPYCDTNLNIEHAIEQCILFENERNLTKKQLKAFKIKFTAKNLIKPHRSSQIKVIIKKFISLINDAFKI